MSFDFQTITHGKWILAGEHAVLRGHPALVFPIKHYTLTLTYTASSKPLILTHSGLPHQMMSQLIEKVIQKGLVQAQQLKEKLQGQLHIHNQIPLGVGLGASAALCVAIARWFEFYFALKFDIFDFSKQLEHVFHGQSSGLDIAGVASTQGVYFKQGISSPLSIHWQPQWYLSSTHEIGVTAQCIQQVQALWREKPTFAQTIDTQMAESVVQAKQALEGKSHSGLAEAILKACHCFEQWQLITPQLQAHIRLLYQSGALAVKPTGSGGGGHVISLWDTPPPTALALSLIAIA